LGDMPGMLLWTPISKI